MLNKKFSGYLSCAKFFKFFAQVKFPKRAFCVYCKLYQVYRKNKRYFCKKCHYQFSLTTRTALSKLRSYSDKWKGYARLVGLGYVHSSVNHSKEEYVSGKVRINDMEGFWGLSFKRNGIQV